MRIIFVPQYPTPMRYQEWWWSKLPEEFSKKGLDVKVLGAWKAEEMETRRGNMSMFSPIDDAIEFECAQIKEYMNLQVNYEKDILFMADISFPGLFGNILFHKRPEKVFGFCHATSLNYLDYFEKERSFKFRAETATAASCKWVFVGSEYHRHKLYKWSNVKVTNLPYPNLIPAPFVPWHERKHDIISVSRLTTQKVDVDLELFVEHRLGATVERREFNNWKDYYEFVANAKVMLITAHEETFGYQVVDAVMNGCIPIAPCEYSYPELLPPEFMYFNRDELISKLYYVINSEREIPRVPQLICHDNMVNFYNNIVETMLED